MKISPTSKEKYTLYLTESDIDNLLTLIYPDYKTEMEEMRHAIGDFVLLKKALIYGRITQMAQLRELELQGIDADTVIQYTFHEIAQRTKKAQQ